MVKYFPGVSKGWVVFIFVNAHWAKMKRSKYCIFLLIHLLLTLFLFHKTSEYSLTRDLQLMNWETERSWFDSVIMWKWQKHRTTTGEQTNHGHDCQQQTRYWHNHKVLLSPYFVMVHHILYRLEPLQHFISVNFTKIFYVAIIPMS